MKIIGLILLSLTPLLISLNYRNKLMERCEKLSMLVLLMKSIKQYIRHTRSPLNEILEHIQNPLIIGDSEDKTDNIYMNLESFKHEQLIVSDCFNKIEGLDIISVCEELDLCIEKLVESENEAINIFKEKSAISVKLGGLGSAFVFIFLI